MAPAARRGSATRAGAWAAALSCTHGPVSSRDWHGGRCGTVIGPRHRRPGLRLASEPLAVSLQVGGRAHRGTQAGPGPPAAAAAPARPLSLAAAPAPLLSAGHVVVLVDSDSDVPSPPLRAGLGPGRRRDHDSFYSLAVEVCQSGPGAAGSRVAVSMTGSDSEAQSLTPSVPSRLLRPVWARALPRPGPMMTVP